MISDLVFRVESGGFDGGFGGGYVVDSSWDYVVVFENYCSWWVVVKVKSWG